MKRLHSLHICHKVHHRLHQPGETAIRCPIYIAFIVLVKLLHGGLFAVECLHHGMSSVHLFTMVRSHAPDILLRCKKFLGMFHNDENKPMKPESRTRQLASAAN